MELEPNSKYEKGSKHKVCTKKMKQTENLSLFGCPFALIPKTDVNPQVIGNWKIHIQELKEQYGKHQIKMYEFNSLKQQKNDV